jgi:hypothetical protein
MSYLHTGLPHDGQFMNRIAGAGLPFFLAVQIALHVLVFGF